MCNGGGGRLINMFVLLDRKLNVYHDIFTSMKLAGISLYCPWRFHGNYSSDIVTMPTRVVRLQRGHTQRPDCYYLSALEPDHDCAGGLDDAKTMRSVSNVQCLEYAVPRTRNVHLLYFD